jgi:hypothetical protein
LLTGNLKKTARDIHELDPVSEWLHRAGRSARACLLMLVALFAFNLIAAQSRDAMTLVRTADSGDYQAASEADSSYLMVALTSIRPPIYPAIIRAARVFDAKYAALPYIQHALFAAGALAFFWCCVLAGFKPWEALLLAAPLASSAILNELGNYMMPETAATSFAVAAAGLLILIAADGPTRLRMLCLSACVTCACLTRPAFLFLPLLAPMAVVLMAPSFRPGQHRIGATKTFFSTLTWTCSPLLAYSVLRFALVGHFGIVSFGGVAVAGIGTNPVVLDESTAMRLPSDEMKRLATAILEKRREVSSRNPAHRPLFVFNADSMSKRPMAESWQQSFDPSIYDVALPATRDFYRTSNAEVLNPDWRVINAKLGELSSATIKQHKTQYLKWIWSVVQRGFQEVFHYETGGRLLVGIAFVALVLALIGRGIAIVLPGRRAFYLVITLGAVAAVFIFNGGAIENLFTNVSWVVKGTVLGSLYPLAVAFSSLLITIAVFVSRIGSRPIEAPRLAPAFATCALAILLFGSGVLLVSLVEMPLKRYIIAVSPLLPGAILLVSVKVFQRTVMAPVR